MATLPPFYITTPIYYVNDVPHLGHVFEVVGIDVQARFRRLLGHEVFFLTGTDEHGQKIAQAAEKLGRTPKQHVDIISGAFRQAWDQLGVSYDRFIRTTDADHRRAVHAIFKAAQARGDIYLGKYEGWYDTKEESFITEAEMKAQGLTPDHPRITRMAEDAYFFRLSAYRDRVVDYLRQHPDFVKPDTRANEVLNSFLTGEVPDLCISRTSITWGIDVPDAPGHVFYVWFDALTNYLTGVGYGDPSQSATTAKWWPADVHVIGKDILKFHAFIWPAMLLSAGIELPRQVFGHGFINVLRKAADGAEEAEKMSKSTGNTINPLDYIARVGVEPLRYFLMREINYGSDGLFSEEALEGRYQSDLANGIGNLVSRTTSMVDKYLAGDVRVVTTAEMGPAEQSIAAAWAATVAEYERGMPAFEYHVVLARAWEFIKHLDVSITQVQPWALAKDPAKAEQLRVFLSALVEGVRGICVLVSPFMPETSKTALGYLGIPSGVPWEKARAWGASFETTKVTKSPPMFPRLV